MRLGMTGKVKHRGRSRLSAIGIGLFAMAWMLAGCSAADQNDGSRGNALQMEAADSSAAANGGNAGGKMLAESSKSSVTANSATADQDAAVPQSSAGSAGTGATFGSAEGGETDGTFERKIVYKGNVSMEVEAYDTAQTTLRDLIHLSGGYLLKFADQKTSTERGGTFTIKVPASGFDGFLAGLEKIKHLSFQSSAQGTDVTEEYVDLQARLKARQVVEARLLDFMAKATKTADLLQISQQLGDVQTEIERIKGRIRYLDANVTYSTIDLRMYEVTEAGAATGDVKRGFAERLSDAAEGSAKALYAAGQGLLVFLAGAIPVLAVLAVIVIPAYAYFRNGRRKRAANGVAALPAAEAGRAAHAKEEVELGNADETDEV